MAFTPATKRKTNPQTDYDSQTANQLDNLQSIAAQEKADIYGADWYKQIRSIYTLNANERATPRFRPRVSIPELQTLAQLEANDLSDIQPQAHLIKSRETFERDTKNETALQAQCRESNVNTAWMYALLWAFLGGDGFIQVGWDPYAFKGRGTITVDVRDSEDVYPDPYAKRIGPIGGPGCAKFLILEDYMWIDEIRSMWPERAGLLREVRTPRATGSVLGSANPGGPMVGPMSFPPGPMRLVGNLPSTPAPGDGRMRVRTCFCFDPTLIDKSDPEGIRDKLQTNDLPEPDIRMRYPYGRMVIECDRIVLYDERNPFDHGYMPIVRTIGMPDLFSIWAPPPARYTLTLQDIGQRLWTQLYENVVRLNNGVWFAWENSGIDFNKFGGLPGEVQMLESGGKEPVLKFPPPLPQHMIELPQRAFQMQRDLQGFTDTRTGKTPPGNVSPGFLENAVQQAHGLTRMRAKLQYQPLRDLYYLIFATMAQFYQSPRKFYDPKPDGQGFVEWEPITREQFDEYEMFIDPDSIMPFSQQLLANRVPLMRNMGLISVLGALEAMKWPNAVKEWERIQQEAQARAQAEEQKQAKKKTAGAKK